VKKGTLLLAFSLAGAGLVDGCGKRSQPPAGPSAPEASSPVVDTNSEQTTSGPPGEAPALPTVSTEETPQAPLPQNPEQLTLALHHWIGQHQRLPKDFEEFAASNPERIPPPPAGKKYVINSRYQVVLVNR
jgi:hypothetical protein